MSPQEPPAPAPGDGGTPHIAPGPRRKARLRTRLLRRIVRWMADEDADPATRAQVLYQDARTTRLRADFKVETDMFKREMTGMGNDLLRIESGLSEQLDGLEKMAAEQPEAYAAARMRDRWLAFESRHERRMVDILERVTNAEASVERIKSALSRSAAWVAAETRDS